MAISATSSSLHQNLEIPIQVNYSRSPASFSPPTKWRRLALSEVENFTKVAQIDQPNGGFPSESNSVSKNFMLDSVIGALQSLDLNNNVECSDTCALILQNCRKFGALELGPQIHARLTILGVEFCAFLSSQLLEFYCKFCLVDEACQLFDRMSERNLFSWTSMIGLYCKLGDYKETIRLFYLMIDEGVRPDHFVFPKVFKACSELKNYKAGKDVYDYMLGIGFEGNPFVRKSLLDMFIKCGKMDTASKLFREIEYKDVVMWNMMISGYASQGDFKQALEYLEDMKMHGVKPDRVTWNSIIAGYAQNGQFKEASECFSQMQNLKDFDPNVVSWTASIARNEQNGCSYQAMQVFRQMLLEGVKPNSITMVTVISACTNLSLVQHGKEIHAYCVKNDGLDTDILVDCLE